MIELRFYVPLISETFPKPISWLGMEKTKPNTIKACIHQSKKCITTQNKRKKLKPGLVISYDIRLGNGEGLFLLQHFINLSLTYLLTYQLTYSTKTHTRPTVTEFKETKYNAESYHQHTEVRCMTSHTKHSCFKIFLMTSQINKSHHLQNTQPNAVICCLCCRFQHNYLRFN